MRTTLESIGAGYRRRAGAMLDDVERILPLIGIREMVREGNGCRLRAYKSTAGGRIGYTFAAHPSAGYIEVTAEIRDGTAARRAEGMGSEGAAVRSVRVHPPRDGSMKRSIERALLTLARSAGISDTDR